MARRKRVRKKNKRGMKLNDTDRCAMLYIQSCRVPPSTREIAQACELSSTSTVNHVLTKLARLGYIERIPKVSRGIIVKKELK